MLSHCPMGGWLDSVIKGGDVEAAAITLQVSINSIKSLKTSAPKKALMDRKSTLVLLSQVTLLNLAGSFGGIWDWCTLHPQQVHTA